MPTGAASHEKGTSIPISLAYPRASYMSCLCAGIPSGGNLQCSLNGLMGSLGRGQRMGGRGSEGVEGNGEKRR